MDNAYVNKSAAEIHTVISYSVPPLMIAPEYQGAHELMLEDLQMILNGVNEGSLKHNMVEIIQIIKKKLETTILTYESEIRYFEENGTWQKGFKKGDESLTKEGLYEVVLKLKKELENVEGFGEESLVSSIPNAISSIKDLIGDSETLKVVRLLQFNCILKMKGHVLFNLKHLLEGEIAYESLNDHLFRKMILRRLLSFYVTNFELRKKYFGTSPGMIITPANVLISMDSSMKIIMDVVCPELLLTQNPNSILGFDMGILLSNTGVGLQVGGELVENVPFDIESIFQNGVLEEMPSYSTTVYTFYWLQELRILLPVIIELLLPPNAAYREAMTDICDKVNLLATEGVSLKDGRIDPIIQTIIKSHVGEKYDNDETTHLIAEIIHIILSETDSDTPKENFSEEVNKIINLISQYV
jgi:hypothetical protein